MGVNLILSKMKNFLLIGVLCGAALASDYQYLEEVSSSSSKYDANEYITSYEVDEDKYSSHRPVYQPHQPHHSTAYRPHYQPQRTAYRYEAEPQYYSQPNISLNTISLNELLTDMKSISHNIISLNTIIVMLVATKLMFQCMESCTSPSQCLHLLFTDQSPSIFPSQR